jgi:hypothetical protein
MLNAMVDLRRVVLSTAAIAVLIPVALANVAAAPPPPPRHFSPAVVFRVPAYGDAGPLCGMEGFGEPAADAREGDPSSWVTVWVCKKGHAATHVTDRQSRLAAL